jgi:cell division protease FtsH
MAQSSRTPTESDKNPLKKLSGNWHFVIQLLIGVLILWSWANAFRSVGTRPISYSELKAHLAKGEVTEVQIAPDQISGIIKLKNPKSEVTAPPAAKPPTPAPPSGPVAPQPGAESGESGTFAFTTTPVEDPKLVEELEAAHVKFSGTRPNALTEFFWTWLLPIGVLAGFWIFMSRRISSAGQSVLSFGKSKAKLVGEKTGVTFEDVAGCDEAKYELQEVVDFLTNPSRYRALGAKIPKGVLLIGPPGTGKTLLARAVAGEAHVPFFSLSGSEFVEMFVGVGASRVRDMFQQAKAKAPCILFIDELDAIGRQRGIHIGMVNDEREQTLNQLLVEMDGFEENAGVILLAATNRPEVLDRALLRPGRFDRQVVVDAPDLNGREAVLKVHARGKKLAPETNLRKLAQQTPGLSGADLANILNEAALLAARRRSEVIRQNDLEEAVEKVIAGPERKTRVLSDEEKHRVAIHESGHAIIAAFSPHADPVHKISIVPHGRAALGYTMQLPSEDQFLMSFSELYDRIKGMLGGRAAEEIAYGEVSTGAENDLERATALARQMVCIYGMSPTIGLVHCAQRQSSFLTPGGEPIQRDCSELTARDIDEEVKKILDRAYADARTILRAHHDQLELVSSELYKHEVMDAVTFNELIHRTEVREAALHNGPV